MNLLIGAAGGIMAAIGVFIAFDQMFHLGSIAVTAGVLGYFIDRSGAQ